MSLFSKLKSVKTTEPPPAPPMPAQSPLEELRWLLLGREKSEIKALQNRIDEFERKGITTEQISDLLPDSIIRRAQQDARLTQSITPVVEDAIRESIQLNRFIIADILFPAMGPAIRKSITQTLKSLTEANQPEQEQYRSLFSLQGLKWRWEALRTRRSFDEVLLAHTLLYRVEQVFLIHKDSGLLLQSAPEYADQDGDLISAMLSAINNFVSDSFGYQGRLEVMDYGDLSVMVEQGPHAILAGVVRGVPAESLRLVLQDALANIHFELRQAFEAFDGKTEPFDRAQRHLASCLAASYKPADQSVNPATLTMWLRYGLMAMTLLLVGYWAARDARKWTKATDAIQQKHGLVVTELERDWFSFTGWGQYRIRGLKDPFAPSVTAILSDYGVDAHRVVQDWEPYQSLEPEMVLNRLRHKLQPSDYLRLELAPDRRLRPVGVADEAWLQKARLLAQMADGVNGLDESELMAPLQYLNNVLKPDLQKFRVYFGHKDTIPKPDEVGIVVSKLKEIKYFCQVMKLPFRVQIVGHASSDGATQNQQYSTERAKAVRTLLVDTYGFRADELSTIGVGESVKLPILLSTMSEQDANRAVSFVVE